MSDLDEEELRATRKLNGASKEIEVGEYVRTDEGLILIYNKDNDKVFIDNFAGDKINITKHSKNIIDLIEVGDILEIEEDKEICFLGINNDYLSFYDKMKDHIKKGTIKLISILTHEQYEQNCFRTVKNA